MMYDMTRYRAGQQKPGLLKSLLLVEVLPAILSPLYSHIANTTSTDGQIHIH